MKLFEPSHIRKKSAKYGKHDVLIWFLWLKNSNTIIQTVVRRTLCAVMVLGIPIGTE